MFAGDLTVEGHLLGVGWWHLLEEAHYKASLEKVRVSEFLRAKHLIS